MRATRSWWIAAPALALLPAAGCTVRSDAPEMTGADRLTVEVAMERPRYGPGDSIRVELRARNVSETPVTLEFLTSQRFDFQIVDDAGDIVWTWSASRGFLQVLGTETLAPGEARQFVETIGPDLSEGTYRLRGTITSRTEGLIAETPLEVS